MGERVESSTETGNGSSLFLFDVGDDADDDVWRTIATAFTRGSKLRDTHRLLAVNIFFVKANYL